MPSTGKSDLTRKPVSLRMRLQNYRLFQDSGWFTVAPLTCLVGRNSSGKSSILSSILLLKQSVEQEGTGWGAGGRLVLSGQYCDLGNYADLVHNHKESDEISVSFSVDFPDLNRGFGERGVPIVNLSVPRPQGAQFGGYYFGYSRAENLPKKGSISVKLSFAAEEPFGPIIRRLEVSTTNVGAAIFTRTSREERRTPSWMVKTTTLPPRSLQVDTYSRAFFPIIGVHESSFRKCGRPMRRRIQMFLNATRMFMGFLKQGLIRAESVGPFRTPPERRYAFGGFGASRGGAPTGEQAIDLLITETLLRPHSVRTRSLHSALSFWVKHLRLAESLDVRDIAKRLNLFQVQVTGAGRAPSARSTSNLADVGFGVSQVLPVLVQGLLIRPGGVFLVQQPEIHLHPDAQAGLADFFIYLASYGIITVVETHSEYLLLRIRRRLAEGATPISMGLPTERPLIQTLKPSDVSVLFTGFEGRRPEVKQLHIGSAFQFENLPSGFMSQALDDRLALLNAVTKKNA
jgi:predicted ATPase